MVADLPFWKTKTLGQMTDAEWESLCDGCGRCCLHKLRDEDTDRIIHTEVSCRLLDTESCLCSDYQKRRRKVPDCVRLTPAALAGIDWLPPTCGYRRIADGLDLEWWHPLVSGSPDSVHQAGVSVRGRAISERVAGALEDHVVDWPGELPAPVGFEPPHSGSAPSGQGASVSDESGPARSGPAPSGLNGSGPSRAGHPGSGPNAFVPPGPVPSRSGPSGAVPPVPGPDAPARPVTARPTIRRMPAAGRMIPR